MQATARRGEGLSHLVTVREHQLLTDLRLEKGGSDSGPSPEELLAAALASCTAMTVELYAERNGWEVGAVAVDVRFELAERGEPTRFAVALSLAAELSDEQVERLGVIAARCPVHRTLEGGAVFAQTVTRATPSG
jgi:putative redox protein